MIYRALLALALTTSAAHADVTVTFNEGAPKDRFTIANTSTCALDALTVQIDLGTSAAGLIFDTTGGGAGVEVFQPLELVSGAKHVKVMSPVKDGDNAVMFRLTDLGSATPVAFTVDIDDTIGQREITVSRSEIEGASVTVVYAGSITSGVFGQNAIAQVPVADCSS